MDRPATDPSTADRRIVARGRALIAWALSVLVLGVSIVSGIGGLFAERWAEQRFGDPHPDQRLDRVAQLVEAEVMSSDAVPNGTLISYEYFEGSSLFVGYARVPREVGRAWRFGDRIEVEIHPEEPALSRPKGFRRAPDAWITAHARDWRDAGTWLGPISGGLAGGLFVWGLVWWRRG